MRIASRTVRIPCPAAVLGGELTLPAQPAGIVLFAHGSGSSRHSPRNRQVAARLQKRRFATLLFDLLTEQEERTDLRTRALRFDIPLLAGRMVCATHWAMREPELQGLHVGYFGASTGTAAALIAAAELGNAVSAVVSRGGRPDLAGAALPHVSCPTLLVVGGDDTGVIELNEEALRSLRGVKALQIVPGASHLFEEPGTLEQAARLAGEWFQAYLQTTEVPS